jgi:hypothetical protein
MPAPQASLMKQVARAKFSANNLRVPDQWTQPSGDPAAQHWGDAFTAAQKSTSPDPTAPPLFTPHSLNKYHTDVQKQLTRIFGGFIDGICDAICGAWSTWQSTATLIGVLINGPIASLGQVLGPPLTPLILAQGPKASPAELRYTTTVATVIGTGWLAYTASIKVPGLPWYPLFAMCPSPVAPPTPNIPNPVAALTQVTASISASTMKSQMIGQLGDPRAMYHRELFGAICDAFEQMFLTWQVSTQVTNVLGTGPVPTFAPPVAPAGPVVAGIGTMMPGGFA